MILAAIRRLVRPGSRANVRLVYLICLIAPALFMLPALAGFVLAVLGRRQADALVAGHYHYQVSLLWRMAVYLLLATLLAYILVGVLLLVASLAWYFLRIGQGLRSLSAGQLPDNPQSWLF